MTPETKVVYFSLICAAFFVLSFLCYVKVTRRKHCNYVCGKKKSRSDPDPGQWPKTAQKKVPAAGQVTKNRTEKVHVNKNEL